MYDRTPQDDLLVVEALVEYHADRNDEVVDRLTTANNGDESISADGGVDATDD